MLGPWLDNTILSYLILYPWDIHHSIHHIHICPYFKSVDNINKNILWWLYNIHPYFVLLLESIRLQFWYSKRRIRKAGGSFKQICFRTNITYGRTGNINRVKKVSFTSYFNLFFKLSLSINRYVKECCLHTYILGVNRAYHIYCFKNKIINLKL